MADSPPPAEAQQGQAPQVEPQPSFGAGSPKIEGLKAGAELAKQIITLAVGMVALTVTFLKDIVQPVANEARVIPVTMIAAWTLYVICILGAVSTLMAVSGVLTNLDRLAMNLPERKGHEGAYDVYCNTVRNSMRVMIIGFLLAICLTVIAAATSYDGSRDTDARDTAPAVGTLPPAPL